jgi:hypothetical protein
MISSSIFALVIDKAASNVALRVHIKSFWTIDRSVDFSSRSQDRSLEQCSSNTRWLPIRSRRPNARPRGTKLFRTETNYSKIGGLFQNKLFTSGMLIVGNLSSADRNRLLSTRTCLLLSGPFTSEIRDSASRWSHFKNTSFDHDSEVEARLQTESRATKLEKWHLSVTTIPSFL